MKKIVFYLLAIFLFNVTCFGQLKVLSDGTTQGGGSNGEIHITTFHGTAIIGPINTTWCHFETDRPYIYFNAPLTLGSGIIDCYTNKNLSLCAGPASRNNPVGLTLLASNDYVGIGTTTPAYRLDVNGAVGASEFVTTSDERLKSDIKNLTQNKIDKIYSLEAKTYIKKFIPQDTTHAVSSKFLSGSDSLAPPQVVEQDTTHQIGFLAQSVQKYFPELVTKGVNGYYSVDYVSMIPLLVEALKEQNKKIKELENRVNSLSK